MAKHHPDLIMCRKQPGIGMFFVDFVYSTVCVQLWEDYARNVTESVRFAIRMYGHVRSSEFVMNATTAHMKDAV